ncbi:hypothetical protein [Fulvivirga ligni]|uniref:hypothetical protein n=1 Tax=Fulvivirga ligni TaxID=2904246 RepID=UPI001F1928E1|nr:hypothetical protein [Fulvivirga ligni]UII22704.1 hypothetical protein LVD16_05625 [Fulvivirga ligni]
MSTHRLHTKTNEVFHCTLTGYQWLALFEQAQAYPAVYKWFDHLLKDGCCILAYMIMPNHLYCLLSPTHPSKPLNLLFSEGKRFMAYAIVKDIKKQADVRLLQVIEGGVQENERQKGKKHQVFRLSFDSRKCFDMQMIEHKLDYIHHNPVCGKWELVKDFTSAAYYELGLANNYVTHYKDLALT